MKNLVVIIPDSLRADFWPDLPGTTFDVIAAGTESPTCIPTMLTGTAPEQHGIKWFQDDPIAFPTVFDLEAEGYDVAYWDNPEDMTRHLLRAPPSRPLEEIEPPFIWVQRLMLTHHPYGVDWTDTDDPTKIADPKPGNIREFPGIDEAEWSTGKEYLEGMRDGSIDFLEDYQLGIDRTVARVDAVRQTLRERGLLEDTFVLVAADHGEAFGGSLGYDDCKHEIHTHQACHHIVNTKATVVDRDVDVDGPVKQQDLLGLWDSRWPRDDLELLDRSEHDPGIDAEAAKDRLRQLGYLDRE